MRQSFGVVFEDTLARGHSQCMRVMRYSGFVGGGYDQRLHGPCWPNTHLHNVREIVVVHAVRREEQIGGERLHGEERQQKKRCLCGFVTIKDPEDVVHDRGARTSGLGARETGLAMSRRLLWLVCV